MSTLCWRRKKTKTKKLNMRHQPSLLDSFHTITLKYYGSVTLSLSDVKGCDIATGSVWHRSCCPIPSQPRTGIDCPLSLTLIVFYITDHARLYPAMTALYRNMSSSWYFKHTCYWAQSLHSSTAKTWLCLCLRDEDAPTARSPLYTVLGWNASHQPIWIFFSSFFVSHVTITQYEFPSQHFEDVIFQQARPLKLLSNGGLWLSGENQTKTGMLMRPPSLPRALFFFFLLFCFATPQESSRRPQCGGSF